MRAEGWLWARIGMSAGGDTLLIHPGPRAHIVEIKLDGADSLQWARFIEGSNLKEGTPYRPGRWEQDCAAGLTRLGEAGYPFASVTARSVEADSTGGGVRLELLLLPGRMASVSAIRVEGATHTRPEVIARLSGLHEGAIYNERNLQVARSRLEAREIVQRVLEARPVLTGSDLSKVDIVLRVEQPQSTGRISAALGVAGGQENQDTRVFGNVDLVLLDLFGTARQFSLRYLDDGKTRRTLDLSYLEPLIFHSPFDLGLGLGQRHQDQLFDTILGDAVIRLPWRGVNDVQVGGGIDRTSFIGDEGILRTRRRALLRLSMAVRRPEEGAGIFGRIRSNFEYAKVAQKVQNPLPSQPATESSQQTIVDFDLHLGMAVSSQFAVQGRARWASVSTSDLPVPVSEQFYIGGATTVRGHREDERHGEVVSHGTLELVMGKARKGNVYAFYDLGFIRETVLEEGRLRAEESWIRGFGVGLRTPAPFGRIDLSLGFPGALSFSEGLIHIALINEF